MDTRLTPLEKTEKTINVAAEVARLAKMTVPSCALGTLSYSASPPGLITRSSWRARSPGDCRQRPRADCRRRRGRWRWRLHETPRCAFGLRVLPRAERRTPQSTATTRLVCTHDSRLPMPGSLLMKEHRGETHVVKVLDNGFEYGGQVHRSLSAIAQQITGTKWNGFLFLAIAKEAAHGRR